VILVLKHGIQLSTQDIVVLSIGLPFCCLWMFIGRTVVNAASFSLIYNTCNFTDFFLHLLILTEPYSLKFLFDIVLLGIGRIVGDAVARFVKTIHNITASSSISVAAIS